MGCVIVTGAAGGIGQALVRAFTDAGRLVIATDLEAQPDGLPCHRYIACDLARMVADPGYAETCFASIRAALDGHPLDALVNNAAVQVLGDIDTLDRASWRASLDVNVLAPFLLVQGLRAELEQAAGVVLNISSIHARLTKARFIAYATSKAALSGMTRAMAIELGGRIRVNAIEPAAIATPMLQAGFAGDEAGYAQLQRYHPTGSIGAPADLAQLACAIVALPGAFANGSIVAFDGGIGGVLHDPG